MRINLQNLRIIASVIGSFFALLACPQALSATQPLTIASIFSDFAVIQRDRPVLVWGRGSPGARIDADLGGRSASVVVDRNGDWNASLAPLPAREDLNLVIKSATGERLALHHLATGDVWLCAGQSNMEFPLRSASNADTELAQSSDDLLRLLLVPRQRTYTETTGFTEATRWRASGPQSARDFSAACYFMGRELRRTSHVPIGLISSAWGGSRIEDWLSSARLKQVGGFSSELALLDHYATAPVAADAESSALLESWVRKFSDQPERANRRSLTGNPDLGRWEEWGEPSMANFDGLARYRAAVTLTEQQARDARVLSVGQVDDIDFTSINGQVVGSTVGWDKPRRYALAGRTLKAGRNLVDVVVLDTGSGGGLWGSEPRGVFLSDGQLVPFEKVWTLQPIASLAETGPPPLAPWSGGEGLATLHNGMIAPLGRYGVKGFAWYQGESNAERAAAYPRLLRAMIDDWRLRFGGQRFLLVQLANFGPMGSGPAPSNWAALREAQRNVAQNDPKARLVPVIDIGDVYDIHPTNKREVGRRLALAASRDRWTVGNVVQARTADALILALDRPYHLVGGVGQPTGVEACNLDGRCRFVSSSLEKPGQLRIMLAPTDVEIRYLWADSPLVSIFDDDGIPLPPFKIRVIH